MRSCAVPSAFRRIVIAAAVLTAGAVAPAAAQERYRISANVGQQASTTTVAQEQTFDRYFEQGSFTFEPTVPKAVIYDVGIAVRLWRALHAGAAMSVFEKTGTGTVAVGVPHPLHFNKPRTTMGDIANVRRLEVGQHFMAGWNISTASGPRRGASRGLDFTLFAGPSIFVVDQLFVTSLMLSLEKEIFPFDELAFPGAQTQTVRENVMGYNAGVDMTWRFSGNVGVGLLLRYSNGKKSFTPTGAAPVDVTVGGLHAGGGLRVLFGSPGPARKPLPPSQQPPPPKQPPKGK
jgi:hypothetical protein